MASTKDTFESATFLADTFAAGVWRGTGTDEVVPDMPGMEYALQDTRLHYRLKDTRLHYHVPAEEP